jgi:hypothetical protein
MEQVSDLFLSMQVFVDDAAFVADQNLRRSPIGSLLRPELAARAHSTAGTWATYTSTTASPPTSGAGDKDLSDQRLNLFDYSVSAVAPVHCDLDGILSGCQQLGGSFTELVVRHLSAAFKPGLYCSCNLLQRELRPV